MLGIATSVGCAIHCAILPVMVTSLPVFGINIIHNTGFEWGMIALAFVVGMLFTCSMVLSNITVLLYPCLFFLPVFFPYLKQFFHPFENWFLISAVLLIIGAHYYNYRLCHRSKCSSPHHKH